MASAKVNDRRRRKKIIVAGLMVFLLLAAGTAWGWRYFRPAEPLPLPPLRPGDYVAFERYAGELITEEMSRRKIVGLSAAVVMDDRIVWAGGFGYADREAGVAATPATVYRAGSISKIPNAVAVLKFRAEGKIDLDAPLSRYIPEFSMKSRFAAAPSVTPRLLLTHHAGLPSDIVKGMWGEPPDPFQKIVPLLAEEYLAYPPGTIYSYGNLGASLLGVMLERVSGRDYAAVLEKTVFQPLDMASSSYAALPPRIERQLARGYNKDGQPEQEVSPRDVPAANLYTTVQDLGNLLIMFLNGGTFNGRRILPEQAAAEMLSPQNAAVPLDGNLQIGYEFFLNKTALAYAGSSFSHGGYMYLFNSQMIGLREQKIAVVVMANSAEAGDSVNRIAEQLIKAAVAVKTGLTPPAVTTYAVGGLPPGVKESATCLGTYGTILGLLEVRPGDEGRYTAEIAGRRFMLLPDQGPWLRPQYLLGGVLPVPLPQLRTVRVAFGEVGGEDVVFARNGPDFIAAGKRIGQYEISPAWLNRQGVYRTDEAENRLLQIDYLELKVNKAGFLTIKLAAQTRHADFGEMVLYPLSDREALIYGLGRRMMETLKISGEAGRETIVVEGMSFARQQ